MKKLLLAMAVALISMSCDGHDHAHGDDHEHPHGRDEHGGQGRDEHAADDRHEHSEDHPTGHDHHDEGHGHGDQPVVLFTSWSDTYEAFGEYAPLVAGKPSELLVHLTPLYDFSALKDGEVLLRLRGPATFEAKASPLRPGIYQLSVKLDQAGTYEGEIIVSGKHAGSVEGLSFVVYESEKDAHEHANVSESDEGRIEFLKEQQWGVPFATAFATSGSLVASVDVAGRIDTPPGGSARVSPPVAGRVQAPPTGFVRPGEQVQQGQLLASLVPNPSSAEDAARAKLLVAEAEARLASAEAAHNRAERLIADGATSQRAVDDAAREKKVAEQALRSAKEVAALGQVGRGAKRWQLRAPIAGTIVKVDAVPGAVATPATDLFSIVDTSELWVTAKVPEQDASRLRTDRPAEFRIVGSEDWRALPADTQADEKGATVTVGRSVDAKTRTVDVIYALREPASDLRVGGLVRVNIPAGDELRGVVVPATAVVDEEGRRLVYVQVDGEHFEERLVRVGARSGSRVVITQGLEPNERVVVKGAHLVRLAAKANSGQAHGHIH